MMSERSFVNGTWKGQTYLAVHSACHAAWYSFGLSLCASGSRSDASTHCMRNKGQNSFTSSLTGCPTYRDDELARALETGVLERLDDGRVRVLQGCVLADEHDVDLVEQSVVSATTQKSEHDVLSLGP